MKLLNSAAKVGSVALLVVGASVANAAAALPTGLSAAITQYQEDVVAAFGLFIAAGIAIFAIRKLGQKLGLL